MVDCAWKNFANRLAEIAVAYKSKLLYMVHVAVSVFSAPQWCSQRQNLKVKASTTKDKVKVKASTFEAKTNCRRSWDQGQCHKIWRWGTTRSRPGLEDNAAQCCNSGRLLPNFVTIASWQWHPINLKFEWENNCIVCDKHLSQHSLHPRYIMFPLSVNLGAMWQIWLCV